MSKVYDRIGRSYAATRTSDPRIAAQIHGALGDAHSVVNVGAGSGSYEPADRAVVAVEPSATMLTQRPMGSAPAVQAVAEALPFSDHSFDAATSVLSAHHWSDASRGFTELRRVTRRRIVLLTFDIDCLDDFWVCHYFPFIPQLDRARFVRIDQIAKWLGGASVLPVLIPADCTDGVLAAFWRRPDAYLNVRVRSGMSSFAVMPADQLNEGLERLSTDLASGAWEEKYGHLLELSELDCGYRLLVADISDQEMLTGS